MPQITFSYTDRTSVSLFDDGEPNYHLVEVKRTLAGENAEMLPRILEEFHYFLSGMTFNYITKIEAHTEAGSVFSSTDD